MTTDSFTASFTNFIAEQRAGSKKPNAEIKSRWKSRIVTRGLHRHGRDGAVLYLRDYGKGISTKKIVAFALMAEQENCADLAAGFWAAAFTLSTGDLPRSQDIDVATQASAALQTSAPASTAQVSHLQGLPKRFQPGRIVTMQPVDAEHPRDFYINSPDYIAQPKRDGNRIVIFANPSTVVYQSRSTSLMASPGVAFDHAFAVAAADRGPFVLDGEKLYLDAAGGEHRTGSQAAHANVNLGLPQAPVACVLAIFKALFYRTEDLTSSNEIARISAAEELMLSLPPTGDIAMCIELVPTAYSQPKKEALCAQQLAEGREGEIWIKADTAYIGGAVGEAMVRTKYFTESEVVVTALTKSSVPGRPFGAVEVADQQPDGSLRPVGCVGTGFAAADLKRIAELHAKAPGKLRLRVAHQGRTENGLLWHARFLEVVS